MKPILSILLAGLAVPAYAAPPNYQDDIRPVFREHCFNCHNPDKKKADLDLTTYGAVMVGGSSGKAVKPGQPSSSLLVMGISHDDDAEAMPPKKPKLPAETIQLVSRWIEEGVLPSKGGVAAKKAKVIDVTVAVTGDEPKGPPPMPEAALPKARELARRFPLTAMAASPWAPLAAVASHEQILIYNTENLELLGALPFPERVPYVLKFSRNGQLLLAAGGRGAHSGKVVVWEIRTGKRLAEVGDELDVVLAADISADHKFVALGGPDKLVKIFSLATGELLHKIKKHTDWVTTMEFSPDGALLASGDRNGGLHVWESETGGIMYTLPEHKKRVSDLSWRADSKLLVSASEDGKLILWDMEEGFPARIFGHGKINNSRNQPKYAKGPPPVLSVEFMRDGRILSVGRDNTLRLWHGSGSKQLHMVGDLGSMPTQVVASRSAKRILAGGFDGEIRLWDDGKEWAEAGSIHTYTAQP